MPAIASVKLPGAACMHAWFTWQPWRLARETKRQILTGAAMREFLYVHN